MDVARRLLTLASVVVVLSSSLCGSTFAATPPALAAPPTDVVHGPLPVPGVSGFAVDSSHGHLLFGSGYRGSGLTVTDLDGNYLTTLLTGGGIEAIVLSQDGTVAYASSQELQQIDEIDLATLTVITTWDTPKNDCAASLAPVTSTLLAFGATCDGQWGDVGVLNVSTGQFGVTTGELRYLPTVRTVPGTTDVVVADTESSAGIISEYDVGSGTPTLIADTGFPGVCGYLHDFAVSPEGGSFVTACGGGDPAEIAVNGLRTAATYVTDQPEAAAISPNGSLVAFVTWDGTTSVNLFHHTADDTSQIWKLTMPQDTGGWETYGHLAFSADGRTLFTLTLDTYQTGVYLHAIPVPATPAGAPLVTPPPGAAPPPVIAPPVVAPVAPPVSTPKLPAAKPKRASSLTLAVSAKPTEGHRLTVSGTLHLAGTSTVTGRRIAVTLTVGAVTETGHAVVSRKGRWTLSLYPARTGKLTIVAAYAGDAQHRSSRATIRTKVMAG